MRGNSVLGVIFSNVGDDLIREFTDKRAFGSVPFGGRYRMIDFPLSNMVNSGINKVAVITKRNYGSLMDHLGSGKSWDLSRRRDGLSVFPPFGSNKGDFNNRMEMIYSIAKFIKDSNKEYVLLSDCDVVCSINYADVLNTHIQNEADITLVYKRGVFPQKATRMMVFSLEHDGRIRQIRIDPKLKGECNFGINMTIIKKQLLLDLVYGCISNSKIDFDKDILQKNVTKCRVYSYECTGFNQVITSMDSYFEANMKIIDKESRNELFHSKAPIYTKIRDDMPAHYGLSANVKNSLVGNGCRIDGEVESSIIFKGVKIGRGSKVSNCVIMQDTIIGRNCNLNYIITDKDVTVKDERVLMGFRSYPVYIRKSSLV
ncbi:MAG: glucose-1-phosphate adenylyltransferase GlcD [Eubacteriales bacterium SKADARSKE-1]|nr:glucose-1-phosphate adenylyltransferase GlcD [Eubacteriales bacterium SKADARSKE-1]